MNYDKSSISFSGNVPSIDRDVVCEILCVAEGDRSGRYLGLPSLVGRNKREVMGYVRERILACING